jgi:hypothetical protein
MEKIQNWIKIEIWTIMQSQNYENLIISYMNFYRNMNFFDYFCKLKILYII